MPLETGTYISDLVVTNPAAGDGITDADNHMRLIKSTIKTTFPNINGAVSATDEQLSFVTGVSSAIQTQMDLKAPLASPTFTGTVVLPATTSISTVSATEIGYLDGVTSALQTQMDLKSPLASPALTGNPTAPTAAPGDNDTSIATTAFVTTADNLKANLASPTFTGVPAAPTASVGTDTTQIATTAFVLANSGGITIATEQATTSGTSKDFTGIPAGTKRITVMLVGVSTNGTSNLLIQLGDAGGFETTGYLSSGANPAVATANSTAGILATAQIAAAFATRGTVTLNLEDASDFTWVATGITIGNNTDQMQLMAGSKSLSAELTQIRFTTVNGTDTFDAGVVNISYE